MDKRWCIYIDIEGFGDLYDKEDTVLWALGDLMEGIYLIGERFCPETPNRIFAHQTGDGFVIVSEFGAEFLDVPTAIAIALLRHVAPRGRLASGTIAEGEFAGIEGCYPKQVRDAQDDDGRVFMGGGLMTTFPVMGTAMINAVATDKASPSGALLTLDEAYLSRLPNECLIHRIPESGLVSVDWIHSSLPLVSEIQKKARLRAPNVADLKRVLLNYFSTQKINFHWKANTNWFLSLGLSLHHT